MPAELSSFTWEGKPLELAHSEREKLDDAYGYTAWIVDQLRQTKFNRVAAYLATRNEVQRLFEPATYFDRSARVQAKWHLDLPGRALALAVYIFEDQVKTGLGASCRQCNKHIGPTPAPQCIVPAGDDVLGGACTNCAYSGTRKACSYVVEAKEKREEEEEEEEAKKKGRLQPLTPALLREMTWEELEILLHVLSEAIERRRQLKREDST